MPSKTTATLHVYAVIARAAAATSKKCAKQGGERRAHKKGAE